MATAEINGTAFDTASPPPVAAASRAPYSFVETREGNRIRISVICNRTGRSASESIKSNAISANTEQIRVCLIRQLESR